MKIWAPMLTLMVLVVAAATALCFDADEPGSMLLSEAAMAKVRGADPENPIGTIQGCESLNKSNSGSNDYITNCESARPGLSPACVVCVSDTATTATTANNATGRGFLLGDYQSCHGEKRVGSCVTDPNNGRRFCQTVADDMPQFCSGELRQALIQTDGPGGPGGGSGN